MGVKSHIAYYVKLGFINGEMLGVLTNSYQKSLQTDLAYMWHFIN
jgi:hypothetical protein